MAILGIIIRIIQLFLLYKLFTFSYYLSIGLLVLLVAFLLRAILQHPEVPIIVKLMDINFRIEHFLLGVYANQGFIPWRFKLVTAYNRLIRSPPNLPDPLDTHIEDIKVKSLIDGFEIPMKIFIKNKDLKAEKKLPIIFYLFPGGFHREVPLFDKDPLLDVGAILVTIKYRLAPEFRFPKALEDAYSCLSFISNKSNVILEKNWDGRLILHGASAGANLATVNAMLIRDRGLKLNVIGQVLCCPAILYTDKGLPSQIKYKDWYFHGEAMIKYVNSMYMRDEKDLDNPNFCPLKATNFKNLPDAYFVLGERDYFCSEAELYCQKLKENGNNAICRVYPGEHAFDCAPNKIAQKARSEMMEFIKKKVEGKDQ